jgi:hypothetical protein
VVQLGHNQRVNPRKEVRQALNSCHFQNQVDSLPIGQRRLVQHLMVQLEHSQCTYHSQPCKPHTLKCSCCLPVVQRQSVEHLMVQLRHDECINPCEEAALNARGRPA